MAVMHPAASSTGRNTSMPQRQAGAQHMRGPPLRMAGRRRSVGRQSQPAFPGEDAPGTGRRHFPEEVPDSRVDVTERPEPFKMRSSQDMYKDFPALVRSSFPLYVREAGPQEPLGEVELRAEDNGPDTRSRRRPERVDPHPPIARLEGHTESREALMREVASRKGC